MLGLGLSLVSIAVRQLLGGAFTPAILFGTSDQGVWYDPSDFGTLFQDAAGTTPAALEQPVGLMLDKSKGLVLGPELVDAFTLGTGWTYVDGALACDGSATNQNANETTNAVAGKFYAVTFNVNLTSGLLQVRVADTFLATITSSGTRSYIVPAANSSYAIRFTATTPAFVGTIDNISVRELPGNHATQPTATSSPVVSARVNQYLNTETLATQNVTTAATSYTLRFEGAGTVTLSGTATGTYSAGTHTITCTSGTLTSTVAGSVTKADLRASNDGVGIPSYQRVNTATDYDSTGFPVYLRADGVDDGMVTNSINFTATDKMTVVAGVRKLSDAASGAVVELSANSSANSATFHLFTASGSLANYSARSNGSADNTAVFTTYTAPIGNVLALSLTTTAANSAAAITARINASAPTVTAGNSNSSTGNFGNYPLYLFRRGGTTLPFNGRFYGLTIVNKLLSTTELTQLETYTNGKTRAFA